MLNFGFAVPTRVTFGSGSRGQLPELVQARGWRRVGFTIDHNLSGNDRIESLLRDVTAVCDKVVVGECTIAEPNYDSLDALRGTFANQDLQAMVAVGGGSALDMGKAMAALVHNGQPAITYRGFDKLTERVLPIVAVPTTAGTGSEVTPNASFVDTREQRKMGINGEAVRPQFAFLDPELTLSCPKGATISSAVDSLVHATEAYVARKSNPMAKLFAREGFRRVFNTLRKVVRQPDDLASREQVMYGAFLSGVALMHSGTGPAAAMSYPLGVHYRIPHGFAGGTFLPFVVAHNVRNGVHEYCALFDDMDDGRPARSQSERAMAFADGLHDLMRDLEVFRDPDKLGLTGDALDRFVKDTLELAGALEQNPVPFGEREIRATLAELVNEVRAARVGPGL